MEQNSLLNKEDVKIISFHCKICKKKHIVEVPKEIFSEGKFPVTYAYLHGDPLVVASLFIDAHYQVRGIQYHDDYGISKNQLDQLLEKSKDFSLTTIPKELIYGFQLWEKNKIIKFYLEPQFKKKIAFSDISKIWKYSRKLNDKKEEISEFFLRYSNYWFAGLEFDVYKLIVLVDTSIDIDHLKTQMMGMLETLLSA